MIDIISSQVQWRSQIKYLKFFARCGSHNQRLSSDTEFSFLEVLDDGDNHPLVRYQGHFTSEYHETWGTSS
jgi:hypothetical protein